MQVLDMWFERNGRPMKFPEVPAVSFSESMRDIDLLVARAIVDDTGNDEGSQVSSATMESRADVLRALAPMFGEGNLEFGERHVTVRGQLARYRIHLASGHIHVQPGAYLCTIPESLISGRPVPLPFADDDRKTTEIIGKVMLLARDSEIKDESLLKQIKRG